MTILHEHNRSRSLEALRGDFLHAITNTTEGVHFASTTLLEDKDVEKEVLAALCPAKANKATDVAITHLSKLFVQCNKWLPVLEQRGPDMYWIVVSSTTSQMQGITLSATQAKAVAFSLLRARQRWIIRQINPKSASTNVKSHLIAGIQRLLQRFEEKDEYPGAVNWQKEREWKLTQREIRDANSRLMGPGGQLSRGRIGLSFHSPHNLYPIGQLSSAPMLERNALGLLDSCVEKITPAEAVQALLSHQTQEAAVAEQLASAENAKKGHEATSSFTPGKATQDDDARSVSSKSPSSLIGRVIPTALKTKFKPNWMKGPSSRKDSGQSIAERPKRAQTADAPPQVNSSSTKKRFLSEDTAAPAKKQVVAKGKARSVSNPVVSQASLTPAKPAQVARSVSLQIPKSSKK
ncbi:uncharacterized protein TRIVIDRAFT_57874 [Trichoderma virens Gv29-8]|uniref:Uncharacterized protein n=1 Tax=Hypocrea virens (strain Gv29-8 / FGSC 10586) TaxID=413071 RepID=G9N5K9_HYPVG|nr:uncharacterized protein TRIVIDRAFT_57874 [Trichoderma virens Gv29-8]EHK18051.1 hypothetical protein TRIVIDRAFT_57874 [Trichoderma virens Gv29-8]UKZ54083.1 hypothetical protein TrVGV298_007888 [Trichoderma virens]